MISKGLMSTICVTTLPFIHLTQNVKKMSSHYWYQWDVWSNLLTTNHRTFFTQCF